jgi:hypothetical protein
MAQGHISLSLFYVGLNSLDSLYDFRINLYAFIMNSKAQELSINTTKSHSCWFTFKPYKRLFAKARHISAK